jgi:tetraacyldisaccharide 4'-kinase
VAYADHQQFNQEELKQRFAQRPLIMTEKDAVKCKDFALENWWYLPVNAQLPDKFAARLLAKLKELSHGAGL